MLIVCPVFVFYIKSFVFKVIYWISIAFFSALCYYAVMNNSENGKYLIDYQFIETPLVINGIGLYQIGKKMCDSDTFSPPHVHLHWFELTIARSGKGIVTTNGVSDTIESGDIYLSFPYDVHSVRSSPEN